MTVAFTFRSLPFRVPAPAATAAAAAAAAAPSVAMPLPPPAEPQWPPRSPHEAALSTPGGRDRIRRMAERTSPSPSPSRHRRHASTMSTRKQLLEPIELRMDIDSPSDENNDNHNDEDEDEEMLQLKLAEIQARLKLKRLQASRGKKDGGGTPRPATGRSEFSALSRSFDSAMPMPMPTPMPPVARLLQPPSEQRPARPATSHDNARYGILRNDSSRNDTPRNDSSQKDTPRNGVEVPASPVRRPPPPPDMMQTSPVRVLLGIDKGLKAKDVSLKRAPSVVRKGSDPQLAGGYLRRSRTPNPASAPASQPEFPRPLTFNERLAQARAEEAAKLEAKARAQAARSDAFGINGQDMERFKRDAVEIPIQPPKPRDFVRDEVMAGQDSRNSGSADLGSGPGLASRIKRSNTVPSLPSGAKLLEEQSDKDAASFEAYSSIHLSRRIIPHHVLIRQLSGKKTMVLEDLLRQVKSPDYSLPDTEQDIVIFGIVAKKSEPRAHKPTTTAASKRDEQQRGKYMVMTLVDLQHEVELFLFGSGFDRFWKLTEGTLVAILNPGVMPPPPGRLHSGRFSLTITSDADTILEIGTARDLGYCKSIKRDASVCGSWVNRRRTEYCEYHTNEAIKRTAGSRLELNTPGFGASGAAKGPRFRGGDSRHKPHESITGSGGGTYDRESKTHWFASRTLSAAELIDGADRAMDRKEREEAIKRRLATKEREQEMMRKLGQVGGGAGREYMRRGGLADSNRQLSSSSISSASASASTATTTNTSLTTPTTSSTAFTPLSSAFSSSSFDSSMQQQQKQQQQHDQQQPRLDTRALGLIAPRGAAEDVRLGPIHKRKRLDSNGGLSASSSIADIAAAAQVQAQAQSQPRSQPRSSAPSSSTPRPRPNASSSFTFPSTGTGSGASSGLGWGGALREKLSRMRDGEHLRNRITAAAAAAATTSTTLSTSREARMAMLGGRRGSTDAPARKKTRFVTDQGIKEAGRESMGRDLGFDLDDDDELIIT